ncbi:MAG: DUF1349 domain-containing protein [Phycisphaerales bacterium]|nr:DUF1349 domain-containing protein [Phycisphaerales bacterium]
MVYHTHQQLSGGDPRQIAVDRMRFVEDPKFGIRVEVDGPTTLSMRLPSGAQGPLAAGNDEFEGKTIDRDRWTIVNEDQGAWRMGGGNLFITPQQGNVWQSRFDIKNLFLQAVPPGDFEAATRVNFQVRQNFEQVFITAWQDHNNYIRLANVFDGGRRWQVIRELGGETFSEEYPNTIGDTVWMKIARHGRTYECSVSVDGRSWWPVGPPLSADFAEVQAGIGAICPGSSRKSEASFEFFRFSSGGIVGSGLGQPSPPGR